MSEKNNEKKKNDEKSNNGLNRRDFLKGVATTPAIGAFAYATYKKGREESRARVDTLGFDPAGAPGEGDNAPATLSTRSPNNTVNIGVIGVGIRGKQLMGAAGFAQPDQLGRNERLGTDGQEPLNIRITGICDLYEPYLEWGVKAAGGTAKSYKNYLEMLGAQDVDAVMIVTPDHWHAPIVMDAARAGKHVYVEKCFTHNIPETFEAVKTVKQNKVVLQLGHQGRSSDIHARAKEIVDKGLLGKVTLIQTFTNRNNPNGAWVYDIPKEAGPRNIDWEQFTGKGPKRELDLKRFFRWRCYWDYGTGLSGDLLTHEWDAVDMVMNLGIPASAVASGGIYYYKDGREVPDLFQVTYEYPDRDLTVIYNATLANAWRRGKLFMGSDATMDLTNGVMVYADRNSQRYGEKIQSGEIEVERPIVSYMQGAGRRLEAVTSPTQQWTIEKGLLYSFTRRGGVVNTAYLHIKNWLEAIREGTRANCNEDVAFNEAITAHMATLSFKEGRRVRWDAARQEVVFGSGSGGA